MKISATKLFAVLRFGAVLLLTQWLLAAELRADSDYTAKAGKISFNVDCNIAFLKVSGNSSVVKGGGVATVNGNTVTVRNLRFEVDPKTLKTGISLRDQHMHEKVFMASDGSIPPIVLRADRFEATLNGNSKWEGKLQGQLSMRGVTKPVSFKASLEKNGSGAVVAAEGTVRTTDFGVKPITYSGAAVDDEVAVIVSGLRVEP